MRTRCAPGLAAAVVWIGMMGASAARAQEPPPIPEGFPRFVVPGHEGAMESLRHLAWRHYPGCGPKATLWDAWLPSPALWPAVEGSELPDSFRHQWAAALGARILDHDGYVATHQHPSIAHPLGWPFPFWNQVANGFGYHWSFKDTVGPPWRQDALSGTEGFVLEGLVDRGLSADGWEFDLVAPAATLHFPERPFAAESAPLLQLRWALRDAGDAAPSFSWNVEGEEKPDRDRSRPVPKPAATVETTLVALHEAAPWRGRIRRLSLGFGNRAPGGRVVLRAVFATFDTRHPVNNAAFVLGAARYVAWTGDREFLGANLPRMRRAFAYIEKDLVPKNQNVVLVRWPGHDGRSGLSVAADGSKTIHPGRGIGNNYWDLLPFGHQDAYATVHAYSAARAMAELETSIDQDTVEWKPPARDPRTWSAEPEFLERWAPALRQDGNRLFWNPRTGRFVGCIDIDGQAHDYGFTFLNLEAVATGFATDDHAKSVMEWITGRRLVPDDTSLGADLYHWRFAPRATTRRNVDWYVFAWNAPESIPFGGQVQDGGAVLGFSYHDLLARLRVLGPDAAWERLAAILAWYDEVRAAGGYRRYYDGRREGTLQGGGTAGGLGMDHEFFESALVPQFLIDGFLGFHPRLDGFRLDPSLPSSWPSLRVDRLRWHEFEMTIEVARSRFSLTATGSRERPFVVELPSDAWKLEASDQSGAPLAVERLGKARWRVPSSCRALVATR